MPSSAPHRHLHSFPTRRSSDLLARRRLRVRHVHLVYLPVRCRRPSPGLDSEPPAAANQRAVCSPVGRQWWRTSTRNSLVDSCSARSEEHTSELQSRRDLVCRLLPRTDISTLSLHDALPICSRAEDCESGTCTSSTCQ